MHDLNIAIIGSPILYTILTLISSCASGWLLFTKKEWVKQLGYSKRILIALSIVVVFQASLLQITTPVKQALVTRFDAPIVDQSTIPEKVTNALKMAEADREVELTKARTLRDQNQIVADGINDKLLAYRALEVQEKMSTNLGNAGSAIFVPYEAMGTQGLSNHVFNK